MGLFDRFRRTGRALAAQAVGKPDMAEQDALRLIDEGNAIEQTGRLGEAMQRYESALRLAPKLARAHLNRGNVLLATGDPEGALLAYAAALIHDPSYAAAHHNIGNANVRLSRREAALAAYRKAIALKPDLADAEAALGGLLEELSRLDAAAASYRRALAIKPDYFEVHSNLLFLHNYRADQSVVEMLAEARSFGEIAARCARPCTTWPNVPESDRRLRVGLVSGDFRDHPVGRFAEGVLAALAAKARDRLEILAYVSQSSTDRVTERIKESCRGWVSVGGISDDAVAQRIRDDRVDILIDLSGHTLHNRLPLFAWKPAPVQVTWLGYFATTGIAAIDYLIADPWTLPQSEERNFVETVWRLPETRLCYTAPEEDVAVVPLPALRNGHITFGCFNHLTKVNDRVIEVWAKVLAAVPNSRLFLKSAQIAEASLRQDVLDRFAASGIDAERLILEGAAPREAYLAAYQRVDIALDPFPYPGGATSVEALWMGVPVLTLAGESFVSRQGVGLMMNAGLPQWVAIDSDGYVARAVAHAGDLPRLAALRSGLREQVLASPIFDAPRFADHFEAALRGMWEKWCRTQHPTAEPLHSGAIHRRRGNDLLAEGRLDAAAACYGQAILIDPDDADACLNLGFVCREQGATADAERHLQRALLVNPRLADAHYLLGTLRHDQGDLAGATEHLDQAIAVKPAFDIARRDLGRVLFERGEIGRAKQVIVEGLALNPQFADFHHYLGNLHAHDNEPDRAIDCYRAALSIEPEYAQIHRNLANVLQQQGRFDEAIASYRKVLSLEPADADMHNNLGNAWRGRGDPGQAIASYRRAVAIDPGHAIAHNNLGAALQTQGDADGAAASFRRALELAPHFHGTRINLVHQAQRECEWTDLESNALAVREAVRDGAAVTESPISPFSFLAMPGSTMMEQKRCAERWAQGAYRALVSAATRKGRAFRRDSRGPIHIGYLSADLHDHATARLMAEVFELHDRGRFRTTAYSYGPDDGSAMRKRLRAAFDRFADVKADADDSVAARIHADEVDILVDLKGYTDNSRSSILALRPAPVQVNYLGYPGTMGAEFIDYLIADPFIIPAGQQHGYTEKIRYLPDCYQPNDRARGMPAAPTRRQCGLPERGMVFCCFNHTYKITPDVFAVWCQLLRAVPQSVMWLLASNPRAAANLGREAQQRGVDPARLVMAPEVGQGEHLARLQCADLFLDTTPVTAHTTCSDALWMGLPVVTCIGETFVSRVAGSLLTAVGIPELITCNLQDYHALALDLAQDDERRERVRRRIADNRDRAPLFDSVRFTRNLEAAYVEMWDDHVRGGNCA